MDAGLGLEVAGDRCARAKIGGSGQLPDARHVDRVERQAVVRPRNHGARQLALPLQGALLTPEGSHRDRADPARELSDGIALAGA